MDLIPLCRSHFLHCKIARIDATLLPLAQYREPMSKSEVSSIAFYFLQIAQWEILLKKVGDFSRMSTATSRIVPLKTLTSLSFGHGDN